MLVGIPKFLEDKAIDLRLFFADTNEKIALKGTVKSADFLPGRKDISIVHIEFDVEEIPMTYKFHINSYITSYQKQMIENQLNNQAAAKKIEAEAAAKVAILQAQNISASQAQAQVQPQIGTQTEVKATSVASKPAENPSGVTTKTETSANTVAQNENK